MLWIVLIPVLLWIGAGAFLLRRDARKSGQDYQREVPRLIFATDEEVEVTLRLIPPFKASLVGDHDVVLALDHSGSMGAGPGSPLEEAVRAAENFARRCPPQIQIGLVAFDDEAQILSPLTEDRRRILRALGGLSAGGGTAIDQGLEGAREALTNGRPGVSKTVILLSDGGSERGSAEAVARLLHSAGAKVICVGYGPKVEIDLMVAVAGGPERYLHVVEQDDLIQLFGFLASAVSGQMAVSGLIDEGARAPRPFHLVQTGGLHPVGIQPDESTRIVWSVPLLDNEPVALTYRLAPRCPGWHPVATTDARATWRLPDGSMTGTPGPRGPNVLVLPGFLKWAWPVLNPLFWMIFGRFFRCVLPVHQEVPLAEPRVLPEPSFPQPLPDPQGRPYQIEVLPTLVIGLGEMGERVLCRLEHRLQDRGIKDSVIERVCITATHHANRPAVRFGGCEFEDRDRIELHRDLRPYVETLRQERPLGLRSWVPWRAWLSATDSLATAHTLGGDRRKARLALLLSPARVEDRLRVAVRRVLDQDGLIVIVAAVGDPEGSGLLAEVAHLCATYGGSSTAVLVRQRDDDLAEDGLIALRYEIERLVALRGDAVLSDRHDPQCEARKLFDRVLVLPPVPSGAKEAEEKAAELVWSLPAYTELRQRMPAARLERGQVICGSVDLDAFTLPMLHLWNWVRERTLAQAVNGRWLGLEIVDGAFRLPLASQELAASYAGSFWNPLGFTRPQNRLLVQGRAILQGQSAIAALLENLPVDALYPEQVAFSRAERRTFAAFCEEWCQRILEAEREKGAWGMHLLAAALLQVERDLWTILERIEGLSGSEDFRNLTRLASGLFFDLSTRFAALRRGIAPWIAALAGEQVDLGVTLPPSVRPLCQEIERGRRASEEALVVSNAAVRRQIEKFYGEWFTEYGEAFQSQVGFRISSLPGSPDLQIRLQLFGEQLDAADDLAECFRAALNRYRNSVLAWPLESGLDESRAGGSPGTLRFGKASARVFSKVHEALHEDDPFVAAIAQIREAPLAETLGVAGIAVVDPQFAWPEESNAFRIAEKIRNSSLQLEPHEFSPGLVHLMRDPERLHAFLADLAFGRLESENGDCRLNRDGHPMPVGKGSEGLSPAEALDNYEAIARRIVILGIALDGRPIPEVREGWDVAPDEALRRVESHPLAKAAQGAPNWAAWCDVIRGLALELGGG
jgi:uncharacterized protein YegL